jgi:hypothetical protein
VRSQKKIFYVVHPLVKIILSDGYVCGSCHVTQYNSNFKDLPLAKPGVHRRKDDDKKTLPKEIQALSNRGLTSLTPENIRMPPLETIHVGGNGILDLNFEPELVIDLSPPHKRKQPLHKEVLAPPKKRRFNGLNPELAQINGHLTLPIPPPMMRK